jgi:hypothetical protein
MKRFLLAALLLLGSLQASVAQIAKQLISAT